jgi:hypothetical protein
MTCHDARELFSALIDEALTREERADVYGHLVTCADCRRELTAIERTVKLVRGTTPVRAPVGFVDRVVQAARPTPWYTRAARAVLLPWPVKLPLGAAAIVLLAGLAVLMFRGSDEQQSAARYEAPPVLADRRAAEAPAETPPATPPAEAPATPAPGVPSRDATEPAREKDGAPVASRVEQLEKRAETKAESAPSPAGETAPPRPDLKAPRAMATAAPHVIGRLAVSDRDEAERTLMVVAARLSGGVTGRRLEGDTRVVDVVIPRERYDEFTREVARLGAFTVESESPTPPDLVRIAVRLTS